MTPIFIQVSILAVLLLVLAIGIMIYRQLKSQTSDSKLSELESKLIHDNEEIRRTLETIQQKVQILDTELENKLVKDVNTSLEQTKSNLIEQLFHLKEEVQKTSSEISSKTDNSTSETKQKLTEIEKEINKTIAEISQKLSENSTNLVKDIKNTIQNVNKEFTDSTKDLSEKIGKIDQQLQNVEKISSEIQELQEILKPPKSRGTFGEILLENLIKDIFPKDRYDFQYFIGTDQVDAIIKLDGKVLPIDSKFPLDNFKKFTQGNGSKKSLINDIKKMIDDISKKYIKPDHGTTNFALMYIPSESIWYELFVNEPEVYKYAVAKRVFPVSPNTIFAYFQVISEGLKAFEIEQDVEIVITEINALQNNIEDAIGEYETLEKHLNNAIKKVHTTKNLLEKINLKIETFGKIKKAEVVK